MARDERHIPVEPAFGRNRSILKERTMGSLDDVLGSAVPQGSLAKPLMIALGALLASGALFKNSNAGTAPASSPKPSSPQQGGDMLGGLGGLLKQFQQSGL